MISIIQSLYFRGPTNLKMVPDTWENMLQIKSTVKARLYTPMGPDTKVNVITVTFLVCRGS